MAKLQFGDLVTMIQSCEKRNEKSGSWIKQEVIINGIFSEILNLELATRKSVDCEKYYVSATQCSQYFLCSKNIPLKIRQSLSNIPFDHLLDTTEHNLKNTALTLKPICQAVRKVYTDKKFRPIPPYQNCPEAYRSLETDLLEQLYENKNYANFLARVILYTILSIPNTSNKEHASEDIQQFGNEIEEFLLEKRFFSDYDRKIIIVPDFTVGTFKTITHRKYSSHFPNPNKIDSSSPSWAFSYTSKELRESLILKKLVINGIDYTEQVEQILLTDDDLDAKYPYKKIFKLPPPPASQLYHVELVTEFVSKFPIRTGFFQLHVPTKKFKCTIKIKGEKKHYLNLTVKYFGYHSAQHKINNKIEPNSNFTYFDIQDWLYPTFGLTYIVKPWEGCWSSFLQEFN